MDFTMAGRSEVGLRALAEELDLGATPLILDARHPEPLVEDLEPGAIVINCIGPFGLYSRALLAALARRPVVYLDVCGEQEFLLDSFEQHHDVALAKGALLIHACAFESFLADLLAESIASRDEPLRELSSFYWFDRMLSSPGTRLTMRLSEHWRTVAFRDGELRDESAGASRDLSELALAGEQDQAVFVPYPEVIFFARRFATRNAASHVLVKPSAVRFFNLPPAKEAPSIDEIIVTHRRHAQRGPTAEQRARQGFGVALLAETEAGERRVARILGRDPYGLTAAIIAWSCGWLLDHDPEISGVRAPAEVFPAASFFEALSGWPGFFEDHLT
jgi:short subunit dehydrogenase-like uncharacterized protein